MTELRQELEKEKATNQLLEDQVEKSFLGAESKAMVLEEEKKKNKRKKWPKSSKNSKMRKRSSWNNCVRSAP